MLTLTTSAKEMVRSLVSAESAPDGAGLRIATAQDDAGQTGLSLELTSEPAEGDEVLEEEGTRVFLEPEAASLLDDKVLDAQRHEDHFHFSLENQQAPGDDGAPG